MSQKKMFEVKCTSCNKVTTVPFEPRKDKPVYCKPCFSKNRTNHPIRSSEPIRFNVNNAWAIRKDNYVGRTQKPKSVYNR